MHSGHSGIQERRHTLYTNNNNNKKNWKLFSFWFFSFFGWKWHKKRQRRKKKTITIQQYTLILFNFICRTITMATHGSGYNLTPWKIPNLILHIFLCVSFFAPLEPHSGVPIVCHFSESSAVESCPPLPPRSPHIWPRPHLKQNLSHIRNSSHSHQNRWNGNCRWSDWEN